MIVRFDNKALQRTMEHKDPPIGVEGDPPVKVGGISEAEAIVLDAKAKAEAGSSVEKNPSEPNLSSDKPSG
jgi:hypothetical protein